MSSLEQEAVKNTSERLDCQQLFGSNYSVHYYTEDIFIICVAEAQPKALKEDPCLGLNWGPSSKYLPSVPRLIIGRLCVKASFFLYSN